MRACPILPRPAVKNNQSKREERPTQRCGNIQIYIILILVARHRLSYLKHKKQLDENISFMICSTMSLPSPLMNVIHSQLSYEIKPCTPFNYFSDSFFISLFLFLLARLCIIDKLICHSHYPIMHYSTILKSVGSYHLW